MAASKVVSLAEQMAAYWDNHSAAHWAAASADWMVYSWVGRKVAMTALGMAALKAASSVEQ